MTTPSSEYERGLADAIATLIASAERVDADARALAARQEYTATAATLQRVKRSGILEAVEALSHPAPVTQPCGKPVGTRPWWMGKDQWEPCSCILDAGHDGDCRCEHAKAGS